MSIKSFVHESSPPGGVKIRLILGNFSAFCWARTQGYCKRGSGGQREVEKIRATFWDSKKLSKSLTISKLL